MQKYVIVYHSVSGATPAVAGSVPVAMERFQHHVRAIREKGWAFGRLSQVFEPVDRVYAYETDPTRRCLKGACNVIFDHTQALALLGPPSDDELGILHQRFASSATYRQFEHAEVGVHTVTHQAFDGDTQIYVQQEILPCREHLNQAGLAVSPIFTLPMRPRLPAVAGDLVEPLKLAGFTGMLDEQGLWNGSSFLIPRIDAKHVERLIELPEWVAA
jgi:hypothetical protein